jgi:hypothetical protein
MREKKLIRFVGYYRTRQGRPQDVFCNGFYPNKIEHEVVLTRILLKYPGIRVERGPDVDPSIRSDATQWYPNGEIWHWELDSGKQSFRQVEQRWKDGYEKLAEAWKEYGKLEDAGRPPATCPAFVLVVSLRKKLDGLLERAAPYRAFLHFAQYKDLMASPYGAVLTDVEGKEFSLPNPDECTEI